MIKPISLERLLFSYLLLGVIIIISFKERLTIERDVLLSFGRMTFQLFLAGFVLLYVFKWDNVFLNVAIFLSMVFFASRIVISRSKVSLERATAYVFISILISAGSIVVVMLFGIVHLHNLTARYFIPLAGMIVGNSMNSTAIGIERFFSKLKDNKEMVEDLIGLGATIDEALAFVRKDALKASLLPSLASASGMGIVFLPGMMTGQILSGVVPTQAVYYQITIITAIASTVCLSNYLMVKLLTNKIYLTG